MYYFMKICTINGAWAILSLVSSMIRLIQRAYFIAFLASIAITVNSVSQDLETIGKQDALKINGGVSLNQIFYTAKGIESRRDPYSYFLTGNLNMSLYGFSVPLSFAISNQNRSFQQPFNQFSLHPKYKWVTAHVGYTSVNFSPYTLGGHIFRGVGVELTPGKFHFSAMYGRLRKAVEIDTVRNSVPAFQRDGFGFKTGYRDGNDYAEVSLFHGKDDVNSISLLPVDDSLLPEENLVMSISAGKSIFEKITLTSEFASSAITRDVRVENGNERAPFSSVGGLFATRLSTSYYNAFKAGLNYLGTNYTLGLGYERIAPGYRTHGAYYFNNDLENYTVNASSSLMEGKLNLSANVGTQHDNLDNTKVSTMKRFVGALNVAYAPTEKLALSANYSNFQSFTNVRSQFVNINQLTPYDNLDTLKFTQLTQSVNLSANYSLAGDANRKQFISGNLSVQDAAEQQSQVTQNSGSRFYNLNTSYSLSFIPSNFMLSVSYNASQNKAQTTDLITHGPSVSLNKTLMERKLRLTLSTAYNNSVSQGSSINKIINVRTNATYTIVKKHNFNLGLMAVNRHATESTGPKSFTEFTGTLAYSYSF